jgi:hypothetical protein
MDNTTLDWESPMTSQRLDLFAAAIPSVQRYMPL